MYKLVEKYLNGTCTEIEYLEVVEWMKNPKNDQCFDGTLKEVWLDVYKKDNKIFPDKQLLDYIHHRIALKDQSQRFKNIRLYRQLLGVAAVLIIGLVIHSLFFVQPLSTESITTQNVMVPYGGKTNFMLPDGSVVWLNSGSTFSYPSEFLNKRLVELKGEAYFDVVPGEKPFIVKSSFGEVEVLGTEFNVKAYDGDSFETTLINGSVVFTNKNGKQARLKPGTQVVFDSNIFQIKNVKTELYTSWREGKLIFREEPLQNIITCLERWYNVDIELKGEDIKNLKYTGTIEMETFSEVLELIRITTPIKYSFNKDTRLLTITSD